MVRLELYQAENSELQNVSERQWFVSFSKQLQIDDVYGQN